MRFTTRGGAVLGAFVLAGFLAAPSSSRASTFTVERGDTLATIAQRNGVPLDALEQANPQLAGGEVFRGDRIVIPAKILALLAAAVDTSAQAQQPTPTQTAPQPAPSGSDPGSSGGGSPSSGGSGGQNPLANLAKLFNGGNGNGNNNNNNNASTVSPQQTTSASPSGTTSSPSGTTSGSPLGDGTGIDGTGASTEPGSDAGEAAIQAIKSGTLINPNTGDTNWSKWCLALVRVAFKKATGRDIPELSQDGAWNAFLAFQKEGLVKQGNPPRGAIVFWSPAERAKMQPGSKGAEFGHIAISNGDGTVISNVKRGGTYDPSGRGIGTAVPIKVFGNPAGYVVIKK